MVSVPSLKLKVITILSSNKNTEFTKLLIKVLLWSSFFGLSLRNLQNQYKISSRVSLGLDISSFIILIESSLFSASSSSIRSLVVGVMIPFSIAVMRLLIAVRVCAYCFCSMGRTVLSLLKVSSAWSVKNSMVSSFIMSLRILSTTISSIQAFLTVFLSQPL